MIFGYNRGIKKVKDPTKVELDAIDDEEFEDLGIEAANLQGKDVTLAQIAQAAREVKTG